MNLSDLPPHRAQIRDIIQKHGVRSALIYINKLTGHRFTALYRFDDDLLKKTYFYDRENPEMDVCPDIPIEASYCIHLKNTGKKFSTANSVDDDRVINHPKRNEILSYCGVPLTDNAGVMFGSICHFDFQPVKIDSNMVELMENFATFLMDTQELRNNG